MDTKKYQSPLQFLSPAVPVVVGLWFSIYKALQDSTGRQLRDLLTEGEQSSFWLRYCGLCAASVIIGFALGVHAIG